MYSRFKKEKAKNLENKNNFLLPSWRAEGTYGSGSVSKCHGSATLVLYWLCWGDCAEADPLGLPPAGGENAWAAGQAGTGAGPPPPDPRPLHLCLRPLASGTVQVLSATETFFVAAPYLLNNKTFVSETVKFLQSRRTLFSFFLLMQNLLKLIPYVIYFFFFIIKQFLTQS